MRLSPWKTGEDIDVHVREDKEGFYVEIQDTGCGISQENLKRIFNPFFTTKDKGTGLGLSIVRKIIEGHKGTIAIESQESKGTRVEILLPRPGITTRKECHGHHFDCG